MPSATTNLAATIFAAGNPCPPALRNRLRKGRFTIVLDGAAERVRKEGWLPNLLAGDFDGVSPSTLRYFQKKGVELLHTPDQDHTDLEKAVAWCALRDFESVWITQAIGSRLDHSFAALSFLRRYHSPKRDLRLYEGNECIRFVKNQTLSLTGEKGRGFAVLPFPACRVRSKGLQFEMNGLKLSLGLAESLSNQAARKRVQLAIEGDALVVEASGRF